ncbi:MAG TPA: hypothetical protein DDY78_29405 [Planctomycetales bacterium]|jgi:hypothetical protein|nr:hypothetical protein [Planctomycetales bacterium]
MAPKATAGKQARVPAAKQPPKNSVWVRYHPWIEGVMGHATSVSLHLLVIGGAFLWFTYIAFALGFAHAPRSLPVEPVVFAGGGGNKAGTGTAKDGEKAAPKEDAETDKNNPGEKNPPIDSNDQPKLTDVKPKVIDPAFAPPDARLIKSNLESMERFQKLNDDVQKKLREGLDASKGNGGTGTGGGTGAGTGEGTGSGTKAGKEHQPNEREKRMLRWSMKFNTQNGNDYLRQLEALGAVLAIPTGPNSFEVVDLTKKPLRPEAKDLSTIQKIWWIDDNPRSVLSLMEAMRLPGRPGRIIAFIPNEVEDDLAKTELAYHHLEADDIFETTFAIHMPGAGGRKYDVKVIEQKRK